MGGFGTIARGLGRFGSELGEASEGLRQLRLADAQARLAALLKQTQLSQEQQRIGIEGRREQLEEFKESRPKVHSVFQTPDGSMYAVISDPQTGEPATRQLYKSSNQYPEFKTLQEMEAWAVSHGDQALLQKAQGAIKATQKPDKSTEFDEWREQFRLRNKRDPNDREIALWHRQPRAEGTEAGPEDVAAYAEDVMNRRMKLSEVPAKVRGQVATYIRKQGQMPPRPATLEEYRRSDLAKNVNENLDQLTDIVKRRPELFGKVGGLTTWFRQFGTSDPDIASLRDIRDNLGRAAQGAHGMRSARGVEDAAKAIEGHYLDSPEAILAAASKARKSVGTFIIKDDSDSDGDVFDSVFGKVKP